jgi:hypothetical protein
MLEVLCLIMVAFTLCLLLVIDWGVPASLVPPEAQEDASAAIESMMAVNGLMEENTDILMRFSHYTTPHTEPTAMCPECSGSPLAVFVPPEELREHTSRLPSSVASDVHELASSMRCLHGHLAQQQVALRHTLGALRAGGD